MWAVTKIAVASILVGCTAISQSKFHWVLWWPAPCAKRFSMVAGVGRALSAPAIVEPANSPKSRACIGSLIPGCKDGIRNLDAAGMLCLFNGDSDS